MSTANFRINKALNLIGATSPIKEARPEIFNTTFEILVSMLELWKSQSIDTGIIIPTEIGDELEEPLSTSLTIDFNLAVTIAPYLLKEPSPFVSAKAAQLMQTMRIVYSPLPETIYPDVLPIGSGNKTRPLGVVFYPGLIPEE